MKKATKPFTMTIHPHLPLGQGVGHFAIGVLMRGYPAAPGEGGFASKEAIKKYGTELFETMHNVYAEALSTKKTVQIRVKWEDGKPVITPIKPSPIVLPPGFSLN